MTFHAPQVHFDAMYRGIDAVSSRYARTLGGNRTIAEPLEFVAGSYVEGSSIKMTEGGGGGLFSGSPGPQPPQAISKAVLGMKAGGRVRCWRAWGWGGGWPPLGRGVPQPGGRVRLRAG